jgi:hypothetical protein
VNARGHRALGGVLAIACSGIAAAQAVQKVQLADPAALAGLAWRSLAREPAGDGRQARLPDARELAWSLDERTGRVWFRVTLESDVPARWFGINVAVDGDGDPANGTAWWGSNAAFRFDRLLTAYLNLGNGYWQGAVGLADAAGVARGDMASLTDDVAVVVDRERRSLALGVTRRALDEDGRLRLIATVGSSFIANDDLPDEGAVTLGLDP